VTVVNIGPAWSDVAREKRENRDDGRSTLPMASAWEARPLRLAKTTNCE